MKIKRYIIKKAMLLLVLLLGVNTSTVAQDSCHVKLIKEIEQCLAVDLEAFPDTTSIWTFALELTIESRRNIAEITGFKTNHPMGRSVEGSFTALKKINFNCIMEGKKRRILVIPFCILTYGKGPGTLSLDPISKELKRLFNNTDDTIKKNSGFLYRHPYVIHIFKTVYD